MRNLKFHTLMSFIKSGIRIVGFVSLTMDIQIGAIILIVAEVIGILEEKDEV